MPAAVHRLVQVSRSGEPWTIGSRDQPSSLRQIVGGDDGRRSARSVRITYYLDYSVDFVGSKWVGACAKHQNYLT